jgi:hypothetical protein
MPVSDYQLLRKLTINHFWRLSMRPWWSNDQRRGVRDTVVILLEARWR